MLKEVKGYEVTGHKTSPFQEGEHIPKDGRVKSA